MIENPQTISSLKNLQILENNPAALIPERLRELVKGEVFAVSYRVTLGSILDSQDYEAICILLSERSGLKQSGDSIQSGDEWSEVINNHRLRAAGVGLITVDDRPLILLVMSSPRSGGAKIESFVEAKDLRRKGLSRAFFAELSQVLRGMGYRYICGLGNEDNADFYRRTGWYELDDLNPEVMGRDIVLPDEGPGIPVVRFLDPELERLCVKGS